MIRHKKPLIYLLTGLLLAGCNSKIKPVIASKIQHKPTAVVINLPAKNDCQVALTTHGYDGDALAQSMHQANMNAANSTAGYNAAAGLAGALISGAIVKSMAQAEAHKQKNMPVEYFLNTVNAMDWKNILDTRLISSADQPIYYGTQFMPPSSGSTIHITPELEVTANYQSLELHALVEVITPTGQRDYVNYFHIQTPSLLEGEMHLDDINLIDHGQLQTMIVGLYDKLIPLINEELLTPKTKKSADSIRFNNHMGAYYERGHIVQISEEYITFKTLRGEIKHYPITLAEEEDQQAEKQPADQTQVEENS